MANNTWVKSNRKLLGQLGVCFVVFVIVYASHSIGLFAGMDRILQDRLQGDRPVDPSLVIVAIDDESLQKIGQWPWPRLEFAKVISSLNQVAPTRLGIDVMFAEDSRLGQADDLALEIALGQAKYPIVLPVEALDLKLSNGSPEVSSLTKTKAQFGNKPVVFGHINLITDPDNVVRLYPHVIFESSGNSIPSFGRLMAGREIDENELLVRPIVYAGQPGVVARIPFWQIANGERLGELAGKKVLIGATAADLQDTQSTPVSFGSKMPGVEIQANIANMILQNWSLHEVSTWQMLLFILIASFLPLLWFFVFRRTWIVLLVSLVSGICAIVVSVVLFDNGIVLPLIHVQLAWILSLIGLIVFRYISAERERHEMKDIFSKYVSKEVLNHIMSDPAQVKLGGEEKQVTLFFSDIRGFTTISEKLSPTELVRVLNRYFTVMTGIILEHDGVVDKYIGDAIMAFWGAPLIDDDQADKALQTSIAMLKALKILNEELVQAGDPEINIGIGLFSGPAVVGNVGSDQRFDYTAMGDTVNAASRLESSNKQYNTKILISQSTKDLLKKEYPLVYVDSATVKGRVEPIKIYTLDLEKI
jgi:adenylate cyclase